MTLVLPTDEGSPALQPWEQREGEPDIWFGRFQKYLLLGPNRTLVAGYRAGARHKKKTRQSAEKRAHQGVPGAWRNAARKWEWLERAAAWDAVGRERLLAEYERDREVDRFERVRLLKAYRDKIEAALKKLTARGATYMNVTFGLQMVTKELRAEFDQEPAQRHKVVTVTADDMAKAASEIRDFEHGVSGDE